MIKRFINFNAKFIIVLVLIFFFNELIIGFINFLVNSLIIFLIFIITFWMGFNLDILCIDTNVFIIFGIIKRVIIFIYIIGIIIGFINFLVNSPIIFLIFTFWMVFKLNILFIDTRFFIIFSMIKRVIIFNFIIIIVLGLIFFFNELIKGFINILINSLIIFLNKITAYLLMLFM